MGILKSCDANRYISVFFWVSRSFGLAPFCKSSSIIFKLVALSALGSPLRSVGDLSLYFKIAYKSYS